MSNKKQQIIINTSGGVIQDVLADNPRDLEIVIVDWDENEHGQGCDHVYTVNDGDGKEVTGGVRVTRPESSDSIDAALRRIIDAALTR